MFVALLICLLGIVILYDRVRKLKEENLRLAQRRVTALERGDAQAILMARMLRHSFMNDLQIISGWLQLGNVTRATDQSDLLRGRLVREGQLFQAKPAGLIMGILNRGAWAEANGVRMTYAVSTDLAGYEDWDPQFSGPFSDALGGLLEAIQGAGGHQCSLSLGLAGAEPVVDVACDVALPAEDLPVGSNGVSLTLVPGPEVPLIRFTLMRTNLDGD